MGALRQVYVEFIAKFKDAELRRGNKAVERTTAALSGLGKALGGAAVVYGFTRMAEKSLKSAAHLDDLSQKLGINTDAIQEWGHAAQMSGASLEDVEAAMLKVQRAAGEARNGSKSLQDSFGRLGISTKDLGTLSPDQLFEQTAMAIGGLSDQQQKAATIQTLFGRSASTLLPLFNQGAAGINKLRDEFRALGLGLDRDTIKRMAETDDKVDIVKAQFGALANQMIASLLPTFEKWIPKLIDAVKWISKATQNSSAFQAALIVLGAAAAIAFAPFVKATAIILGLILVIDDLIAAFRGGKSVIGDFFAEFFKFPITDLFAAMIRDSAEFIILWQRISSLPGEFVGGIQAISRDMLLFLHDILNGITPIVNLISKIPGMGSLKETLSGAKMAALKGAQSGPGRDAYLKNLTKSRQNFATDTRAKQADAANAYLRDVEKQQAANQAAGITQNANVTINAPGADPKQIERAVKTGIEQANQKMLRDAKAGMGVR